MLVINQLTLIFSVDPICYHLNLNTKMYYRGMTAFFFRHLLSLLLLLVPLVIIILFCLYFDLLLGDI